MQKRIFIAHGKGSYALHIAEAVRPRPGNLQKLLPFRRLHNTVPQNPGQIESRRRMHAPAILRIQPVRRNKIRIVTPNIPRLRIHQYCKSRNRTRHMLRNRHRTVIMRLQHHGIEKISQAIMLPRPQMKLHVRHRCGIIRDHNNIVRIRILQRQNQGHDLGGAGHGTLFLRVFCIQNTPGIGIHQDGRLGVEGKGVVA